MLVVIAIVGVLMATVNAAIGRSVTRRHAAKFPETLSAMIASLPPLAMAKQEPAVLRYDNGYVYVSLEATSGLPDVTRVAVPRGVTIDAAGTLLARADATGLITAPNNPLHLVVNDQDVYLYIGIAGDVRITNSLGCICGGYHAI